jgi:dTDP-4-dehydrorhamnose 3,5-epimerase
VIEGARVRAFGDARKVQQSVTREGESIQELIDGVRLRHAPTQADERGELVEVYDERWEFTTDPVVYSYFITLQPGAVRGWALHLDQDDRLFFAFGTLKVALYDAREESATLGLVNVFFLGNHDRALMRIPAGVWHAVRNAGSDDAGFVNLPSKPYDHADPDKYRLPIDTDAIPYRI